jgi:hypothetical protein
MIVELTFKMPEKPKGRFKPIGEGSVNTLYRQRKRMGLVRSPNINTVQNEKFFLDWSDDLAWVLGLIWTDGHINGNTVSVCSKDLEMLERIASLTKTLYPPKPRKNKNAWDILMNSRNVCSFLRSLGLENNKTFTATFPKIPSQHRAAFVRGLIDGDGSVCLYNEGYATPRIQVFLCGASLIYQGYQEWLSEHKIHSALYWNKTKTVWKIQVWRVNDLRRLHSLLYPTDDVSCLQRKKLVFDRWINEYWVEAKKYHSTDRNPKCVYCGGNTNGKQIRPCKVDAKRVRHKCKSCKKYSYFYSQDKQLCLNLGI